MSIKIRDPSSGRMVGYFLVFLENHPKGVPLFRDRPVCVADHLLVSFPVFFDIGQLKSQKVMATFFLGQVR